jgi:hypothetical protein
MKYQITRYGPGGIETLIVEADGGDDAAMKGFKPGTLIRGIEPAPADAEADKPKRGRPALQGE